MNKLSYILIFIAFSLVCSAQELKEIAVIDIDPAALVKKYDHTTTKFVFANKKSTEKYYCLDIYKVIEPFIKQISPIERKRLLIIAENSEGGRIVTSYADYDPANLRIQPVFVVSKADKGILNDTIKIGDVKGGREAQIDVAALEKAINVALERNIHLQVKEPASDEKKRVFSGGSLIFPQDMSTSRWLHKVVRIRIYLI